MMFNVQCSMSIVFRHVMPCWQRTEDLEEADEEGMPLLACAKEFFEHNALEKRARTGF